MFRRLWNRRPSDAPRHDGESSPKLGLEELDGLWDKHSKVLQRGMRRLSIVQQEQKDGLLRIEDSLREILAAGRSEFVSFPVAEVLAILDDLERAEQSGGDVDAVSRAVLRCAQRICSNARWTPIAHVGEEYSRRGTEIVDSVESPSPAGIVCDVVRQGYLGPDEELIREAKVIVSAAAERDESPLSTMDRHQDADHG